MAAITITAPTNMNGTQLAVELAAAGIPDVVLSIVGDQLVVAGASESQRATVQQTVAAHVPAAAPIDPIDQLKTDAAAATTVAGLRTAIVTYAQAASEP